MKGILFGLLSFTVMATSTEAYAEATSLRPAVLLVEQEKIGQNLLDVALATAQRTVTYESLVSTLGRARASNVVSQEIRALLPLYQKQWDDSIAQAYEQVFSEEALSSLAREGRSSRYAPEVAAQQSALDARISVMADPILADLVAEALKNASSIAP